MTRLRKSTPASGQRRLHRRRWRSVGSPRPSRDDLIQAAADEAQLNGKSLTQIRRHVLNLLLNAERPMTAYEVLAALSGVGSVSPPTAYRALEFLIEIGFVKRIESLNAYVALHYGPSDTPVPIFICERCGMVEEIDADEGVNGLLVAVSARGMAARHLSIEVRGECRGKLGCAPAGESSLASGGDLAAVDQHRHE